MTNLQVVITADRQAVGDFVDAARRVPPARWAVPRAAGKWSPGQVTEHVALTYEQSRRMLLGTFTGPVEPWFRQLLARWLFLRPMFKRGDFGKGASLAPDFIQPTGSPASSGDLLARLEAAVRDLETDLAAASNARRTHVDHPIFGRLPIADLLRFLMIHTQHHQPQLSAGAV
jgi:DinB family protein